MKKKNPRSRGKDVVIQEVKGEILIYDLNEHKGFCLNKTSAFVWQACDGTRTALEISSYLSEKLGEPFPIELVWLTLNDLKNENLLDNFEDPGIEYTGLPRRELIKKVGFATMISLPLITSLIAPTAATASSVCNTPAGGCGCNFPPGPVPSNGTVCASTAAPNCSTGCTCRVNSSTCFSQSFGVFCQGTCS